MAKPLLWADLQKLTVSAGLPELGPGPRPGVDPVALLASRMEPLLAHSGLVPVGQQLIRATVFLWHDHLDAAHRIAQGIESADGSYVHALMHRREPDYWNSQYWWKRVGSHPCFVELGRRVENILGRLHERGLLAKIAPGRYWDACAFVDACERVAGRLASDPEVQALLAIQAQEFEVLLAYFCQTA